MQFSFAIIYYIGKIITILPEKILLADENNTVSFSLRTKIRIFALLIKNCYLIFA